jgi:hypothetical protein
VDEYYDILWNILVVPLNICTEEYEEYTEYKGMYRRLLIYVFEYTCGYYYNTIFNIKDTTNIL